MLAALAASLFALSAGLSASYTEFFVIGRAITGGIELLVVLPVIDLTPPV